MVTFLIVIKIMDFLKLYSMQESTNCGRKTFFFPSVTGRALENFLCWWGDLVTVPELWPFWTQRWQGWAHRDLNLQDYFGNTQNMKVEPDFKNSIFFTTVSTGAPAQDTEIAKWSSAASAQGLETKALDPSVTSDWKKNRTSYRILPDHLEGDFSRLGRARDDGKINRILRSPCLVSFRVFHTKKYTLFLSSLYIWQSSSAASKEGQERVRNEIQLGKLFSTPGWGPSSAMRLRYPVQKCLLKANWKWERKTDLHKGFLSRLLPLTKQRGEAGMRENKLRGVSADAFLLSQNPLGISWCTEDISELISTGSTNTMCLCKPDTRAQLCDIEVAPVR